MSSAIQAPPDLTPAPVPNRAASSPTPHSSNADATPHPLPAGGKDPDRFDWSAVWYPVAYVQDLDRARPTRFTLLEQDLVIWWDGQAETWRAFRDRCPHRLVPLSEGRIAEDGLLECPYHGWAFGGDGTCERIPQQPEGGHAHQSERACAQVFATAERQGLLFIYAGAFQEAERTPIPIVEPLETDLDQWLCIDTFRDLPYDALTLLENVLDSSHIPFTHHKSVGNRANAAPIAMTVVEANRQGFQGHWPEGPRRGKLGPQTTTFVAPALMWHDLTSKQFGRTLTVVYATPIRKGECRIFARFPFQFAAKLPKLLIQRTPRWYAHFGQNAVLEDDQIFLHLQERTLAETGGSRTYAQTCYLPTQADRLVLALHQWITTYNAALFPDRPLPRTTLRDGGLGLSLQEQLLDRYQSHTRHCASCRTALRTIQKIRRGIALGIALAWTLAPLVISLAVLSGATLNGGVGIWMSVVVGMGLVLLSGGVWLWLGKLENQFYQGRTIPPRNQ